MATCLHCMSAVFEHLTADERIVYCARCGWEHRERLACRRPRLFKRATPRVPARQR